MGSRTIARADLPAIVALLDDDQLATAREDPREPLDPGYHVARDAISVDPNQWLLDIERGGAVVSTMQLSFLPGVSHRGMVRPDRSGARRAALARARSGAAMIAWAVGRCRERGCPLV